jgi:hypothetical protein
MGSWAAVSLETRVLPAAAATPVGIVEVAAAISVRGVNKRAATAVSSPPAGSMPSGMVLAEQMFRFYR